MRSACGIWTTAFILVIHIWYIAAASQGAGPIQLDLSLSQRPYRTSARRIRKRDGAPVIVPATYDTQILTLTANATVGTPPQEVQFIVTSNSADTIVLAANDTTCASHACGEAVFEASQSSTYQYINSNFSILYADNTGGDGFYVQDTFTIGGTTVDDLQFGLLLNGSLEQATLGLGYIALEHDASSYANLPYRLFNQKSISVNAFSVWFEDQDSTTGKLVFGGVDTGKFNGSLEAFTISTTDLTYQFTTIKLSQVSGSMNGEASAFPGSSADVILNTGTTSVWLPNSTIVQIAKFLGATFDPSQGVYVQKYSDLKNESTIDMTLGSTTIQIPLAHLIWTLNDTYAYFDMYAAGDGLNDLGMPFLRNAYVVFDYTHNQLMIAPLLKSSQSNITSMSPNGAAGLVSTFQSSAPPTSNNSPNTTTSAGTGGTSSTSSAASTSTTAAGGGLTSSAKLGIGLGVGLGVPFLLAVVAAIVLWRRRKGTEPSRRHELDTPTNERYSQTTPSIASSALGGFRKKIRSVNSDDVPELPGSPPLNTRYEPRELSTPSNGPTASTSQTMTEVTEHNWQSSGRLDRPFSQHT